MYHAHGPVLGYLILWNVLNDLLFYRIMLELEAFLNYIVFISLFILTVLK